MALAACDGGDSRGRRAVPLCGSMAVRLDVGGAQRSLLPRRLGCGVLMAVASMEVSVSGLLVARLVAACFGVCWRHHGGVACGNQATTHQGHHGGVLVAPCRILRQWCVGGVVVACRRWFLRGCCQPSHGGMVATAVRRPTNSTSAWCGWWCRPSLYASWSGCKPPSLLGTMSMTSLGIMFLPEGSVVLFWRGDSCPV
jgi:hypothetical protein